MTRPKYPVQLAGRLAEGAPRRVIAAEFGVHQGTISGIKLGKNWRAA